ncbi:MAG: EamA family transporter [Chloroflexi bacterium]|nr:EamA family transporter [Chloroflexota bacterium]
MAVYLRDAADLILLRVLRVPAPAEPTPRGAMLLLGVLFAAVTACAFFALDRIPASLYTVLLYSYPAMVALISSLMGEPLSVRGWIALGLTLVGVTLTVPLETIGSDAFDGVGILLAVFNAAIYAGYLVISGRALRGRRGVSHVTAWVITGALLPLIVLAPFRGLNLPSVPEAWVGLIAIALFSTVMPLFAMLGGTARLGAARVDSQHVRAGGDGAVGGAAAAGHRTPDAASGGRRRADSVQCDPAALAGAPPRTRRPRRRRLRGERESATLGNPLCWFRSGGSSVLMRVALRQQRLRHRQQISAAGWRNGVVGQRVEALHERADLCERVRYERATGG